jgi:phosphoribosylformylglycinamidine cyclo-ligase
LSDAYASAGVDTARAHDAIDALVSVLSRIRTRGPSRSVIASGHYASVLRVTDEIGIALSTDGVGSKLVVAEQTGRLDTVGIDCVAMNVNDIICVGAKPMAVLDYLAVERADPQALAAIATGLARGAELADVEIPGGEVAVLPELIRGHPSPGGFDLTATAIGIVALDSVLTGAACRPGDALIGLPSSGLHSNGYSLARAILRDAGVAFEDRPDVLEGSSVADALLEPTLIYVEAVLALLESDLAVTGLAHITGDGVLNLLRMQSPVGFEIDDPLPVPAICRLVCERGAIAPAEAYEVFNMGCGMVCMVARESVEDALALLHPFYPGAARIGSITDRAGWVEMPALGLSGDRGGLRPA